MAESGFGNAPTHTRFLEAVRRFDEVNAQDPRADRVDGVEVPRELAYARRMTETLDRFAPEASEELRLAARAQHIARWRIPRESEPMDRAGYKRWRSGLMAMHAELAGGILREVGYGEETIDRVAALLRKRGMGRDPEVQVLEDVICLVFLQHYLAEFAAGHPQEKVIDILRKTWGKMSPLGREAALALDLDDAAAGLVRRALQA